MEAALVFPMVILAVIGVICILIYLYTSVAVQAYAHMSLRAEADLREETGYAATEPESFAPSDPYGGSSFSEDFPINDCRMLQEKYIYAGFVRSYGGKGLLNKHVQRSFEARAYILEETEYIRSVDLLLN